MSISTVLRPLGGGLRVLAVLTVIVGVLYPAAIWAASRLGTGAAEGSPLRDSAGCVVGSALIGVDPQVPAGRPDPYFHLRLDGDPTADDPALGAFTPGDPAAADANDLGPDNPTLVAFIDARRAAVARWEGVAPQQVPADAVTSSGSSIDPQISPAYAALQVPRVARVNQLTQAQVRELVAAHTSARQWGFLGEPRVDVPALNVVLGLTAPACSAVGQGQ